MDVGGTALLVVIGSFAVDRIVSLALFGLSLPKAWRGTFPDPDLLDEGGEKRAAARIRRTWYFTFATALSLPIVSFNPGIRVLTLLGISSPVLDVLLSTMIFVAGADRLADWLKKSPAKPHEGIEVFGSLTIDGEKGGQATAKCPACSAVLEAGSTFCGHCGARLTAAAAKAG